MADTQTETGAYVQHGYTTKFVTVVLSGGGTSFSTKDLWAPGATCADTPVAGTGTVVYNASTKVFDGSSFTANTTVYLKLDGRLE